MSSKKQSKPDQSDQIRKKRILFSYPPLPRLELLFYASVVFITLIHAYHRIYQASRVYNWDPRKRWWSAYTDQEFPFGLGKYRKDVTDEEWHYWTEYAPVSLLWFIGHFILLNISERVFPSFCTVKSPIWSKILIIYWITAHCFLFGTSITAAAFLQGLILYILAGKFKSRIIIWLVACSLLFLIMQYPIFLPEDGNDFWIISCVSYKVLHYLSYTLDMIKENDEKEKNKYSFLEMITFAYYLPYSISLIVLSKDARRQWAERNQRNTQCKSTLFFGIRIIFWYIFAQLISYLLYFTALINDPSQLNKISKDTLVSVGMAVGQFFHLKYVLIFGYPSFFAKLDRMQPQNGPICISRLTLYSKIWRYFDPGLYAWFKEYIFLPLCRPTFSIWRKFLALLVTYGFVLLWHGFSHDYIIWVILSLCEIFIEQMGKGIYTVNWIRNWREKYISDLNFRRILAWFQVLTFAFGLYANFYFLGSSRAGWVFVKRIFWEETVTVRWPFLLLISLGYCQSHLCMEVDRLQGEKGESEEKESEDEKKKTKMVKVN